MRTGSGVVSWWLVASAFAPLAAGASQPCLPETMYFGPDRASSEWREHARWVAVGTVLERHERKIPYPNCALADRSQCNQLDLSELVVQVERYEKGRGADRLRLVAGECAMAPPGQAGGRYRFYGLDSDRAWAAWEQVTGALGPAPRLRIAVPVPGDRVRDSVEVHLEVAGFTPCSGLAVDIDGKPGGTFKRFEPRIVLDSSRWLDGRHRLSFSVQDCEGRREVASVDVVSDNPPFTFESFRADQPYFQNGAWAGLEVQFGGNSADLRVSADFSAMDSGYATGAERVEPLGGGRYRVGYRLTAGNTRADGDHPVRVVAASPRGEVARELDLPLRNTPPVPFDIRTAAAGVASLPGDHLSFQLPDAPRDVVVLEGDGQTIFPDMPAKFRLRWKPGPRAPVALWVRGAGYTGWYRIALAADQTEETLQVTWPSSTPPHRIRLPRGESPALEIALEYAPKRKSLPAERFSAPARAHYRLYERPASEAEAFPPKGARGPRP